MCFRRSALAPRAVGPDAMELLASRPWPGNVRELRNVLEQASLMTDDLVLDAAHFERLLQAAAKPGHPVPRGHAGDVKPGNDSAPPAATSSYTGAAVKPLQQAMAEAQAQSIRVALAATKGNKAAAARLLGISRAALYEKLSAGSEADGA